MPHRSVENLRLSLRPIVAILALLVAACGGDSAPPTQPEPVIEPGTVVLTIAYDQAAQSGLAPAGFKSRDVSVVEISIIGGLDGIESFSISGDQTATSRTLEPGEYTARAMAHDASGVLIFESSVAFVIESTLTTPATLAMEAAIGNVFFNVDGETSGIVTAVAPEPIPFSVVVLNTTNRMVSGSTVQVVTNPANFAEVEYANTNRTNAEGRVEGTITAPSSGTLNLGLIVDGRPLPAASQIRIEYLTGVDGGASQVLPANTPLIKADGIEVFTFTAIVQNGLGDRLPDTPVTVSSDRNSGVDPMVDIIEPASGYEDGRTDDNGQFRFNVRSFTSSFMRLDSEGILFSPSEAGFVPSNILVVADGVAVADRNLTFNSVVDPDEGSIDATPQFPGLGGTALITVQAEDFNGGPVRNGYVELISNLNGELNVVLNEVLDITPEPGFNGFRTNDQGVWRGRIRSSVPLAVFMLARVDGRTLNTEVRSVIFN